MEKNMYGVFLVLNEGTEYTFFFYREKAISLDGGEVALSDTMVIWDHQKAISAIVLLQSDRRNKYLIWKFEVMIAILDT